MQQDNAPKDLRKVKRGEIYVYDFGKNSDFVRSGIQHVLVIQCDELNQRSSTTIVAVVTMAKKKTKLVSHTVLDTNFGLKSSVTFFFEQIRTVNQNDLHLCVGRIDDTAWSKKLSIVCKKTFGLWIETKNDCKKMMCLCTKCLATYQATPRVLVSRLNHFCNDKYVCCKCEKASGYEYVVTMPEKKRKRGG